MEIKTRFNIGDRVIVFKEEKFEKPIEVTIDTIATMSYTRKDGIIRTYVDYISAIDNGATLCFSEEETYANMEEFKTNYKPEQ